MANRARFETTQGRVSLSRGLVHVRNKDTGTTQTFVTAGEPFAGGEVDKWNGKTLEVDVQENGKRRTLAFEVTKSPKELREEGLKAFAPGEAGRLRNAAEEGDAKDQEKLAYFEKRYAAYLPRPKTSKKSSRPADTGGK